MELIGFPATSMLKLPKSLIRITADCADYVSLRGFSCVRVAGIGKAEEAATPRETSGNTRDFNGESLFGKRRLKL
jgi:hypothetical protein